MKQPSPQAQAKALITLMTLPGNTMSPEVQARYCELAMKGFDDNTVIQAAEEAALTLERRPTPGEFRYLAYEIMRRHEAEQLNAPRQEQLHDEHDCQTPEEYVQEAIERFKATNPTPEDLQTYVNALMNALREENYVRVAGLAEWPERAFRQRNYHTKPLDKTQKT